MASAPAAEDQGMNAQPEASVTYLEPVPGPSQSPDRAVMELALTLDTERNANRAMLATVKELDRQLGEQRAANAKLEAQLGEYALALTHQTAQNKHLRATLKEADARRKTPLGRLAKR